ncbi:MAG: hypothetical protein JO362_22065 [Streptomycetaceae bacterium]|nr:hypothetical protein [Streptomycetaceae bacterium]
MPPRHAADQDPNRLITPAEFARLLGHKDTTTLSHWIKNPPPGFPTPKAWDELPSGRRRPRWKLRHAQEYASTPRPSRTGAGRRTGSRNAPPHAYTGDPRLDLARSLLTKHPHATTGELAKHLAQQLQQPPSHTTLTRIINTARQHPTPETDS